jgi:integrase
MPRSKGKPRRAALVPLPKNVFRVQKPSGKEYYYHQTGRAYPKEFRGALTRIRHHPHEPEFWTAVASLNGENTTPKRGSFKAMIAAYKTSPAWNRHTEGTRKTYGTYLKVIEDAWGAHHADDLTIAGIITQRDIIAASAPASANMFLTVLRSLLKWGVNNQHCTRNLAREVSEIDVDVEHAFPWPDAIWNMAVRRGPKDIQRLAFLGRETGQRISDLIRMTPENLKGDVITTSIKKRRNKLHQIPLGEDAVAIIRAWKVADGTPFITRADGRKHTERSLRQSLERWVGSAGIIQAEGEEIRPHGLRAMAACDARLRGLSHEDISALYGMSLMIVKTYTHHIDTLAEARNARGKLDVSLKTEKEKLKTSGSSALIQQENGNEDEK